MNGENSPPHRDAGSRSLNMIQIQERVMIERVNAAFHPLGPSAEARLWHQRARRATYALAVHRAARREALRALLAWGFTEEQAKLTIQQADEMAELERNAR